MYVVFDFSRLPKKERKFMEKREVEKRLNELVVEGKDSGFLVVKSSHRFNVPYQIGRDIEDSAKGQIRFEFYSWEKRKPLYRWCLSGHKMPTKK